MYISRRTFFKRLAQLAAVFSVPATLPAVTQPVAAQKPEAKSVESDYKLVVPKRVDGISSVYLECAGRNIFFPGSLGIEIEHSYSLLYPTYSTQKYVARELSGEFKATLFFHQTVYLSGIPLNENIKVTVYFTDRKRTLSIKGYTQSITQHFNGKVDCLVIAGSNKDVVYEKVQKK